VLFRFGADALCITHADAASLMAAVQARLTAGSGFALATLNLDHLVKLRRDGAFRRAYAAQDMVVADGNPVVWLSRLAGRPVSLVPGADMVVPLVQVAARAGRPLVMVGATPSALSAAAAHLQAPCAGAGRRAADRAVARL
jgi:N-acetylglucosaminyldiphosphoundecaprenol N-acetyl-beta-D-mannosaminyltransferase